MDLEERMFYTLTDMHTYEKLQLHRRRNEIDITVRQIDEMSATIRAMAMGLFPSRLVSNDGIPLSGKAIHKNVENVIHRAGVLQMSPRYLRVDRIVLWSITTKRLRKYGSH